MPSVSIQEPEAQKLCDLAIARRDIETCLSMCRCEMPGEASGFLLRTAIPLLYARLFVSGKLPPWRSFVLQAAFTPKQLETHERVIAYRAAWLSPAASNASQPSVIVELSESPLPPAVVDVRPGVSLQDGLDEVTLTEITDLCQSVLERIIAAERAETDRLRGVIMSKHTIGEIYALPDCNSPAHAS